MCVCVCVCVCVRVLCPAGSQALLLAPTEILAQQHHEKFVALVKKLPKKTQQEVLGKDMTMPVLLTGSLKVQHATHNIHLCRVTA